MVGAGCAQNHGFGGSKSVSRERAAMIRQGRFLLLRLGRCDFGGLTTWLSSGSVTKKTTTRAEVGGQLIHSLSKEDHQAACA